MSKVYLAGLLLCLSSGLFAQRVDELEIEGKILRVGGNGANTIFVRSERGDFQISVPNVEIYNSCERYLIMKMGKGYRKVRLINVDAEKLNGPIDAKLTLDNSSFCTLEGPSALP